jgi:hypothetical protein
MYTRAQLARVERLFAGSRRQWVLQAIVPIGEPPSRADRIPNEGSIFSSRHPRLKLSAARSVLSRFDQPMGVFFARLRQRRCRDLSGSGW